jgi:hypothetical protein
MMGPSPPPLQTTDICHSSDEAEKAQFKGESTSKFRLVEDRAFLIGPAEEKALIRKVDLHVVPPFFVLFVIVFLDRVNIGNARIQGLEKELNMKGNDYNIALLTFCLSSRFAVSFIS